MPTTKIHRATTPEKTLCGVPRVGLLPYVKGGGIESNYVWDGYKVTCKRCKAIQRKNK